jgi:hypothetical protein
MPLNFPSKPYFTVLTSLAFHLYYEPKIKEREVVAADEGLINGVVECMMLGIRIEAIEAVMSDRVETCQM